MKKNFIYFLLYFSVFITVGLLIHPLTIFDNNIVALKSTNLEVRQIFRIADPGSFAQGSWILTTQGWDALFKTFYVTLWPPGFMMLQATILKIFGPDVPIVLAIMICAAVILAIGALLFKRILNLFLKNELLCFTMPFTLLLFSQYRFFMIGREGVMLGETFSINFVFIGILCCLLAYYHKQKSLAVIAGFSFALSAYFRSQFETIFMLATIIFLVSVLIFGIFKLTKHKNPTLGNALLIISVSMLSFQFFTLPYRIYLHEISASWSWVHSGDLMVRNNFLDSEYLVKAGGNFIKAGGGNIACQIDPVKCSTIEPRILNNTISYKELRSVIIHSFFQHPFKWIYLKAQFVPTYWFSAVDTDFFNYCAMSFKNYLEGGIFFLCFVFSIVWSILTWRNPYSFIISWFNMVFVSAFCLIFLIAHFEVRYLFFFKFYFFMTAAIGLAQALGAKNIESDRVSI